MGRKGRAKATTTAPGEPGPSPRESASAPAARAEIEPIADDAIDTALFAGCVVVVGLVALWFELTVNRVFDVPKALALKTGGGLLLVAWLVRGLFGRGYAGRSVRLFLGPVLALLAAVGISTIFSLDPWMSFVGVYERQFGFEGILACTGLYLMTATCLRSRRGAVIGLGALAVIGGTVGGYAFLQSRGVDPYGFFTAPHTKVYAMLGNATFAGNALALILPISVALALVATLLSLGRARPQGELGGALGGWAGSFALVLALQILPSFLAAGDASSSARQLFFKLGVAGSMLFLLYIAAAGTQGPSWAQFASARNQRLADAMTAGALSAFVLLLGGGILWTRTRGAWVGTAGAAVIGSLLMPFLFADVRKDFRRALIVAIACVGLLVVGGIGFLVVFPKHVYSQTIFSIPYAFSDKHTVYGKGQGTRRYLWVESPQALLDHDKTLERKVHDWADYEAHVSGAENSARAHPGAFEQSVRRVLAIPFGLGIETYRYAFMSHKSKKLEALDPMTNHDNPLNNYLYVLASCGLVGLAAYLWLLWRMIRSAGTYAFRVSGESALPSRSQRAIALGILMSFVSYAGYSIAGFDSVACSVFLYLLLGCTAAFFVPSGDEAPRPFDRQLRLPRWATIGAAVSMALLALWTAGDTYWSIYRGEETFVGEDSARNFQGRVRALEDAIKINPRESYYRQTLGTTLGDAARQYDDAARQAQAEGELEQAKSYAAEGHQYFQRAEQSLYAALEHAWAPENIFISLFQLYYMTGDLKAGEHALERALEHSPHLAPVRANLAVLKLERGAYREAIGDCRWVLEIDGRNALALRTCGRAYQKLGDAAEAKRYFDLAARRTPNDPTLKGYVHELEASTATRAPAPAKAG